MSLRFRPQDGAVWWRSFMRAEGVVCASYGEGARGSVFQTGLPFRQESGGLKTPGYGGTVPQTGLH